MDIKTMQKIVDDAPEWAVAVNMNNGMYYDKSEVSKGDVWLIDLRAQLAKRDLLKLEAIVCDGDKISDEARELVKAGFVDSMPTIKTVLDGLNKENSIQVLDLEPADIPHGCIVLEK